MVLSAVNHLRRIATIYSPQGCSASGGLSGGIFRDGEPTTTVGEDKDEDEGTTGGGSEASKEPARFVLTG